MKKLDMTTSILGVMIPSLVAANSSSHIADSYFLPNHDVPSLSSIQMTDSIYFNNKQSNKQDDVFGIAEHKKQQPNNQDDATSATLSFLAAQGLLDSKGVGTTQVNGEVSIAKELAASCQVTFGCTTAYGSKTSCEAGPGPGVWYPDTDDCTAAAPDPDINLKGNGQSITSGTTALSASNHTDFGSHQTGGSNFTRTFTIENVIAASTLNLSGSPLVSISASSDFSISSQPGASSLNGVTSTTFVVQLDPTTVGSPTATVTITSNDPNEGTYTFNVGATVTAANTAPVVDLDTAAGGNTRSSSFSEGGGAVGITNSASVTDAESDTIKTITVSLTNDQDGASEGLNVTGAAQNALNGVSGKSDITLQDTISITGATATLAQVQTFLDAITYNNTSSTPNTTARTVTVVVNDGTDNSVSRTSTVSVANVTSTTSSGASFNTTTGANLNPAILFTSENESLTIAQTAHAAGSTADGGGGTDTLNVSDGVDISGLTTLTNFETLDAANNGSLTLSETQHESFSTINGVGINQFTISSGNGDAAVTGDADIETYVLGAAMTFTLGSASQNVSGSSSNDVINVAALTPTGTLDAGGGTGDTLRLSSGANIAGATVSNTEILELNSGASVTMTEAQHDSFSSMTATGTDTITISAATDGLTGNATIESYVLSVGNTFTLGSAGQNLTGSGNNDTVNVGTLTATGTLAGGSGTDTLSVGNGGSIAGATVSGFENLTLSSGASATFSAAQLSQFSGTVTAAGTETISVFGDGNVSTVAGIENYTIGDDSTNTRTVTVAAAGHSVTANSATDAVTFDVGTLTFTGTLTGENTSADTLSLSNGADISGATISNITNLALATGASVTMTAAQNENFSGSITAGGTETIVISGDGDITTLSGIENYTIGDDSSNTRTINVGATTNVTATSVTDAITFNIAGQSFSGTLTGQPTAADVVSASDGANTTGASFSNVGTLSLASGATVTIDAQNVSDFSTAINGAAGTETLNLVSGGTFDFSSTSVSSIENISLGSNSVTSVTITDNFSANGGTVTVSNSSGSAINAGVTINASALAGDSLVISATDLTGNDTLTGGDSADTIRPGSGTDSITGNGGNDNFVGSASDLNGDTIADLAVGDMITVTGVTGLTTSNVRFNGNSTLQVDTDATDFAAVEIALTLSNSPGASLDFTVADSGANTVITFIAANDVPVFSSLNGLSTFTENGSAVAIDSDATVADTELDALNGGAGNYNGASLTITRNGGANAQDVFANLSLLGTLTQGNTFTYNGTSVGTVTTNSAGTLVLTFNTSATSAIVDGVIQSISYSNTSDDPPSSVTLDYTFNDGTANSTGTNQAVVNITAQNDAPTDIALSATSINQSATGTSVNVGTLSTTDLDSANVHAYSLVNSGSSASGTCTSNAGNSSFQISGSNLQTQSALSAGDYIVCVQTNDGTTTFQESFTITVVDNVAPNAPSTPDLDAGSDTGGSNTDNVTSDTTPTFSGTAESGSTVRLYSDQSGNTVIGSGTATGGNWQITTSALSAATHAITAKATDASNNESSASSALNVTIDTSAPNAPSTPDLSASSDSGTSNTDNITNDTTPTITGTGTTGDTINLSSNLDGNIGSTTVSGGAWSITSSTLQAGSHTISAQSVDNAGNTANSASNLSLTIDTQAPSGQSVALGDTLYSNTEKTAASFSFSNAEVGATYSYTISSSNGGTSATGNGTVTSASQTISNIDLSALNDGTLTLSVTLTDTAGNAATAVTATSTLDTSAPTGHSVALNDTSYNSTETGSASFSFSSAEVGASYTYTLNSSNGGTEVTGNGNITSASQTVNIADISGLNDGTLTLSVTVSDAAGNAATAVTDTASLDKTKPTVTTFSASDTNLKAGETATISIVLSEASTTFTSSDITVSGGSLSNFSSTSSTQYSVLFTPTADSETNATLDIAADTFSDAAGNNNTAATQLPITVDTKAPTGHSVSLGDTLYSNTEKTAASFSFSSAEVGATYSYTISSSNGGTSATGNGTVTSASQTISNIDLSALNDGTLTLSVTLTDTAGNAASAVTATSELDTSAPSGHSVALNDTSYNSTETGSASFSFSSAEVGASYTYTLNSSNGGTEVTGNGNITSASQTVNIADISGLNDGTLTLSVTVSDAAGNAATAVTDTASLDKTKPTVTTFSASDTNLKAGETATISIVLSEASTTFTSSDITVSGGSLSNFSSTSSTQYSVLFTPTADSETNATLDIAADTFSDAAGNNNTAATQLPITVDTKAPTGHSVSLGDTLYSNTEKTAASFSFSSAEVGATYSYTISSSNGGTSATGNGTVTSASQTISNIDLSALNDGTLTLSVTLTDTAGNAATAVTATSTLDTSAPSGHSVALNDTSYNSTETGSASFSFSSAEVGASYTYTLNSSNGGTEVTGNGNITSASQTVNIADISGLNDGTLTLSVTVSDAAGNAATAVTDTASLDKTKPTVTTFSASDTNLKAGETSTISIVLSEASTTFTSSDITVSGGSLSNFSATSSTQYSVLFTPTADSETNATLDIAADTFSDAAGNNNTAATQLPITVDTKAPTGHSVSLGDTLYSNTEKTAASFSFSSAEVGATYSYTISSSNGGTSATGNGTVTSASQTISNIDLSALNDGTLTLSVTLTDTAGNAATAVTATSELDTSAPSGHSVALNDTSYNSTETGRASFSFSSAEVGASYTYTLNSSNGGTEVTGNGNITSASQTVNIADISGLNDGTLTLSVTVSDAAGNAATAVTDTATLDKTKPTVTTFSASDTNLKAGETSTISIVLSEASTTFTSSDITVSGGSLSNFSATSSTQYSVLFTPTADSETNATLDIAADTFSDAAGNNNTAATQLPITVDTKAPTGHSVSLGDTLYSNTEKTAASFSFSSAEVGATYSYTISSSNGGTSATGNGTVTSASQTISNIDLSALNDGTLTLSVTLTDTAGNTATAVTATSELDTSSPSVTTFSASDTALKVGETATVTIVLSESSDNFTVDDVSVSGGTLSNFTATSGTQYSVVFTPSENSEADATLDILAGKFTDSAGNPNTAAQQITLSVDTSTPTGQAVNIDQALINRDNESAMSFSLTGLESSGTFTYSITDANNASVTGNGNITAATAQVSAIDVSNLAEGTLTLTVIVTDAAGNSANQISDTVTKKYNVAPTLSGQPTTSIAQDQAYSFTPTLVDPDEQDTHTYSITNLPSWLTFSTTTGVLSGTPADADVGEYNGIVISVNDGTDSASLASFNIEVTNVNDAPSGTAFNFATQEAGTLSVTAQAGLLSTATDDDTDNGDTLTVEQVAAPSFGQLTLNTDGSFTYQHDGSENHTDQFTYRVKDASNATSDTYTVTINVTPIADAPTAVNDVLTVVEDNAGNINLLANDSDPEQDMVASSATVVTAPSKGSVSLLNGVATYTPNANENGVDTFTYTVKDAQQNTSNTATVTVTITADNDLPVAKELVINTSEDTHSDPLQVRAQTTDIEDGIPTGDLAISTQPSKGSVVIDQQQGTFVYQPAANQTGSDSFAYTVADSAGAVSAPMTITVTIGAVNDKPVAAADSVTTDEDVSTLLSILSNDSDVEDQGFNGANITLEDQGNGAGSYEKALVTIQADGQLNIAPVANQNGTFTFNYTLTDSEGLTSDPAQVTVTLTPVNDAPVAVDNTASLQEEGSFEVNVLGNDTDVDESDSFNLASVTVVDQPQFGQAVVNAQGGIVYTPNEHYFGDDTFTYTVQDAAGATSNKATVTMTVTPVNDAPIAQAQNLNLDEDGSLLVTLNATDQENDALSYRVVTGVSSGTLVQQSDTTWLYTPTSNFNGVDTFTFVANDGTDDSAAATVSMTVNSVNDQPTVTGQAVSVDEETQVNITLSAEDIDNDNLTYLLVGEPSNGSYSLNGNVLSYTGNLDYFGADSFTFKVNDGQVDSELATVNITVNNINDAPTISGSPSNQVNEDSAYSFVPTAEDKDGDNLTYAIENLPSWMSFDSTTGAISGTPVNANVGVYTGIVISVSDGTETVALTAFNITVVNTNDAPTISGAPSTSINEDSAYSFTPSATDIDGDNLTFSIQNAPAWVEFNSATGEMTGIPLDANVGTDTNIIVSVSDGQVSASLVAFDIVVNNTNDAPTGIAPSYSISEGATLNVSSVEGLLSGNFALDDDLDSNDVLSIVDLTQPTFGTLNVNADGSFTYAHNDSETQSDSFTYRLQDSFGAQSTVVTASIEITPVSEPPVAVDDSAQTNEDVPVTVNLLSNDTDPEGDIVASSAVVVDQPAIGSVLIENGVATYIPNQDVNGADLFTYIVSDQDSNNSDKATVSITISAINDVPQIEDITVNIDEDAEQTSINVRAFATDIEDGIPTGDIAVVTAPQKGSAVSNDDTGSIEYTPFEDDEGTDSFTYTIADSNGAVSELATVSINIGEINDAPIAADDSVTTQEDTQITLNVLSNDTDVEDEGFNGANITLQNNGVFDFATVAILTDGQLQITPTQDQNGQFSFTYTLNDSEGLSSLPATVNLTIVAVNDAPVAIDDIAALEEEGAFAVNVLGNDTDVDGNNEIDSSSVTIVSSPAKGLVSIDGLGRIVYTANTNEVGNDTFTYTVKDTSGLESNVATVTMTIDNVNDAPDAQDDSYSEETFDEATGTYRLAVLSNDSDVDTGDSLTLLSAQASVGSVTVEGSVLVYTPEDTFNGVVIIDYVIKDEAGEISRAVAELTVVRNDSQGTPPTINVPADINVNATALFTKVELGNATATDSNGNVIGVSLVDNNVLFPPGRHLATWQAQDSNGLSTFATQNVFVNPLVSLAKDTQLSEGQSFALGVYLNGEAIQYPVQIPYTVSGTANSSDHTLSSGTLTIASGIEGEITFSIFEDGLSEGNESIIITLDDSLNRGAKFSTQVTIVEENVAPNIVLSARQDNELRTTVTASEQLVTVSAQVSDPNIGDNVQLQWSVLDNELQNISTVENEFIFSAQSLSTGIYGISITATDDGEPSLASTAQIYLEVVPELVVLTDQDTDGDLIPDNEEGHSDSDNDGIPDFQDAITDCNVMQEQALESSQFLIEGEPGVCIRKGVTIAQNSTGGVQLLPEELQQDDTATNIGGLFDFIAVGLPQAGDSYSIVIPQRNPIPINAVYRKLIGTQWVDFVIDEQNKIYSSLGEPGYCAPPGSEVWQEGLTEGDWCVKLQIVDGGPNDDDGIANGSIIDPGGVAIVNNGNSLPVAVADEKIVGSGQAIQIDVLANDTDADGDTLTITSASVDFGTVVIEDNKLLYTPPQTFVGTATIQYSITDGQGGTASNTVTVNLTVNSAPTTTLDVASTTDQASIILNVLENDFDADGDTLSVIEAVAQNGTVTINSDGTISYTPKSGFEGVDIVTYTVLDSKGAISKGIAQVTVTAYKAVAIENTSSGSLGGGLILILSALLVRRRKSVLPSFALASLSCILPFSAYADGWVLKGTLGQAHAAERVDNNSGLQIKNIDNTSESWSVSSYYELLPNWHVGIGYVDLGQGRVDFEGESLSPAESHLAVSRIAPVLPEGFTLQVNYDLYRWQKLTAEVFVGVFDWEYKIASTRDERFLQTYEAAETNAFMGAELGYHLSERVELGVQYRYFDISENNINEVSMLMAVKF